MNDASNRRQVEAQRKVERLLAATELADMRAVLKLPEGRRTLWRFLSHCSVFASIYDSSSKIYANAARQDVGHFILSKINEADEGAFILMMQEAHNEVKTRAARMEMARIEADRAAKAEE